MSTTEKPCMYTNIPGIEVVVTYIAPLKTKVTVDPGAVITLKQVLFRVVSESQDHQVVNRMSPDSPLI